MHHGQPCRRVCMRTVGVRRGMRREWGPVQSPGRLGIPRPLLFADGNVKAPRILDSWTDDEEVQRRWRT